ncbi:hypothetical protein BKA65DRAFT_590937 [Rhexocercosporidium sp. MPI-PUGE-AT-0058]|nr:hypothetical protein BKA65DRAFT_590937 [Rhexocercosporidium sp. MPI-PUGE-AT-0058]
MSSKAFTFLPLLPVNTTPYSDRSDTATSESHTSSNPHNSHGSTDTNVNKTLEVEVKRLQEEIKRLQEDMKSVKRSS